MSAAPPFYTHFRSREDILQKSLEQPAAPLAARDGDAVSWLVHMHGQRRLDGVVFESPAREIWIKCLAGMILAHLERAPRGTRANPELPLPMIATIVAHAQLTIIISWLRHSPNIDPETTARALETTTRVQLAVHLDRAGNTGT